jgi:hypothetical protein
MHGSPVQVWVSAHPVYRKPGFSLYLHIVLIMKPNTHSHPKPRLNRAIQYSIMVVFSVMIISAPLQVLLALLTSGWLFILSAFFTLLLSLPVLMISAYAPAVSVNDEGITLHPVIWAERFVPWKDIRAVNVYPLLPTSDTEIARKFVIGKKNYATADGIMLVIPGLPPQYRIVGFFAGEHAAPTIALTNRAHINYETLIKTVLEHTNNAIHNDALLES